MTAQAACGPLAGIRVVELCTTIAGPACTRLLADFGADVIKIEPPEGDAVRQMSGRVNGVSLYASSVLRNKRSIALDLKTPEGRQIALELIAKADVLVENNRPGVLERLGLAYEQAAARNPGIVYVRISGYGQSGPYRERAGYGAICEAFGGVRHLTGDPDRPPSRVALATTDYLSSVYAAFGALAALRERDATGRGQVVDVALYEAAFSQLEGAVPEYDKTGAVPVREGPNLPYSAPNSLYPTRDGQYILIGAFSEPNFKRLAELMGQPELLRDPRFATLAARGGVKANTAAIDAIVGAWSRQHDAAQLERLLLDAGIPVSRVYTIADIFEDPHYQARGMLPQVPHPVLGQVRQMGVIPQLSRTPGQVRHAGPAVGADSAAVLGEELGYDAAAIQALVARGVVRG